MMQTEFFRRSPLVLTQEVGKGSSNTPFSCTPSLKQSWGHADNSCTKGGPQEPKLLMLKDLLCDWTCSVMRLGQSSITLSSHHLASDAESVIGSTSESGINKAPAFGQKTKNRSPNELKNTEKTTEREELRKNSIKLYMNW